jgi:superfamily II DNA or RNA helicase
VSRILGACQRLVAYRLKTENRIGNWSGTGAGKTLGAILGSRVIDAKLSIIIGLNNTILDEQSGWAAEIRNAFAESNTLIKQKKNILFTTDKPNYLLLNYETFQLDDSKTVIDSILENHKIDLIVLDEVHSAKSKDNQESKRRQLINYLLLRASQINPDLRVLGMSATPVINSLDEAVSLIEMIKGREYKELDTAPKLSNALAIHEQLVINGIRYVPNYSMELKERAFEVVNNSISEELRNIGRGQVLQIERTLLQAKLKSIVELCKPGTLIYSQFVKGMFDDLSNAIKAAGMTVARFNGEDKTGLEHFKKGKVDVLLGSSAISTGVDGLQYVCNRLIIASLPWTSAAYEQLLGRIYRQGSKFTEIEVFIPQSTLSNNGDNWSWDKQRLARIKYKKTLADAAVDGNIPEANLMSPAAMLNEAKAALDDWIKRLEDGQVYELSRRELKIPLPPDEVEKSIRKYGDFSLMNQRFNTSKSTTMHDRLVKDPEEFYLYHSLYREARATWSEVPFEVISEQVNKRPDWVIGDFGCGEALLSKGVRNKVYSYDHVAVNPSVIACDMANTGADSDILDVAVFSLSLMGVNWEDYLKEAFRMVKAGGLLKIAEPASNWESDSFTRLKGGIQRAGFELLGEPRLSSKFVYIDAAKPL